MPISVNIFRASATSTLGCNALFILAITPGAVGSAPSIHLFCAGVRFSHASAFSLSFGFVQGLDIFVSGTLAAGP